MTTKMLVFCAGCGSHGRETIPAGSDPYIALQLGPGYTAADCAECGQPLDAIPART